MVKIIVDVLLLIDFILVMLSGYIREFREYHVQLSWILVALVVLHLLLNANMIKCMILNFFKKK